ncbi:MAG: putative Ig domain-containing protein [Planctomycetaceae bacterium]|nr:putative Ig domain-containing protein [Planctomycetaceae bacterium]
MLSTQCRMTLLAGLWSVLTVIAFSAAAGFGPADAYTWGIDNASLGIAPGSTITNAKLTIHNAAFAPASTVKNATIRLLNNVDVGMTACADGQTGDLFAPNGALVAELKSGSLGTSPQNVVIDLAAQNDPAAAIWKNFGQPFEVTLANGSKVSYSSVMLALLDYAGSGRSFGFGVNCDGLTFTNLSLELTVASMTVSAPVQTLRFSASNILNTPPMLDGVAEQTVSVGQALQFTISATDPDGDALAYSASGLPQGAMFNGTSFAWTPSAAQVGTYQVTFTVSDGSDSTSVAVTITVTAGSSPVELVIDNRDSAVSMVGTWPVSGGVNPYGTDAVYCRDAGKSFSWLFTAPETGYYQVSMWWTAFSSRSSVTPVEIQYAGGTESTTVNQLIDGGQWNILGTYAYQAGTTYRVTLLTLTDRSSICADAVRFVKTDTPSNNPPALSAIGSKTVEAGTLLTITPSATDPDGDALTYSASGLPQGAVFNGTSFAWTPSAAQAGTYQVTFTVSDGSDSTSVVVTITVTAGSSPVELVIDNRDSAVAINGTWPVSGGVNPYETDAVYCRDAGRSFSWLFTAPETGSYEVSMWWTEFSSRSTVTPVEVQYAGGTDSLTVNQQTNGGKWNILGSYPYQAGTTYRVRVLTLTDRSSICADAVRFVKTDMPSPINNPPVLAPIAAQQVTASNRLNFTLTASDPDGDAVTLSAQGLPSGATFSAAAFSWTPTAAQAGTYNVTFSAADAKGGTDAITVQITVLAPVSQWIQLTSDDFESGWGNYTAGTDGLLYRNGKYAHQGSNAANIQSTGGSFTLTSGRNTSRYAELKIEFWYMPVSMETGDAFRLDYYDGSQWRRLKRWTSGTDFANFKFYSESVSISASAYTFPANMKIRFVCEADDKTDDVMIDELVLWTR